MKHVVLGAGGVGGFLAGALARAGHPVTVIARSPDHPHRLQVESAVLGDFEAEVEVAGTLPPGSDVVWVTVKGPQLPAALRAVPADRLAGARVVPLMNGVEHVAELRRIYGAPAVTPGTIQIESERVAPGRIRQLSPAVRVSLAGPGAEAIVAELKAAGLTATLETDESTMLWRKLTMLAALALTTTSLQAPLGAVRADPRWRESLLGVVGEAAAVAAAEGAALDLEAIRSLLLTAAPDSMRSSMQKDRAAGNPLEIDAIGGAIQRAGRRHRVPTPVIDSLVAGLA